MELILSSSQMSRHFPKSYKPGSERKLGDWIKIGTVEEKGDDIRASRPFIQCNLADFMSEGGHFNLVHFFSLQKDSYPYIYKLVVCMASIRTNEVGCERFFSSAGYVSDPRRTSLKVRNYEAIAMLKRNMQNVYVNEEWVVQQYLEREKTKNWDKNQTADDKAMYELERDILVDQLGVNVEPLQWGENEDDDEPEVDETNDAEVQVLEDNVTDEDEVESVVVVHSKAKEDKEIHSLSSTSIPSSDDDDYNEEDEDSIEDDDDDEDEKDKEDKQEEEE